MYEPSNTPTIQEGGSQPVHDDGSATGYPLESMMGPDAPSDTLKCRELEENALLANIGETTTVAEIGCGNGRVVDYLEQAGHTVTGVDFSEDIVTATREMFTGRDVQIVQAKAENLSCFTDGQFECVVGPSNFIGNVSEDPKKALLEMLRIARSKVIICLFSDEERTKAAQRENYTRLRLKNLRKVEKGFSADDFYSRRFSEEDIETLCSGMNYAYKRVSDISYIVVINKLWDEDVVIHNTQ